MKMEKIDKNCQCPFCGKTLKDLPKGLEIKEIIKIANQIIKEFKNQNAKRNG